MPVFECDPEIEVTGRTVIAFTTNLQHQRIKPILETHGLSEIDPETWYRFQDVLNVMRDVSQGADAMTNFVSLGLAAGELGAKNLPPTLQGKPFEEVFMVYPEIANSRFRNGTPGTMKVEQIEPNHLVFTLIDNSLPDDIYYGVLYGYARQLFPEGTGFVVEYDPEYQRSRTGGDTTLIHITW